MNSKEKTFLFTQIKGKVLENFSLKDTNTWRVGGDAKYYIIPEDIEDVYLVKNLAERNDIPLFILGNGSNILFDDRGYNGIVLHIGRGLKKIEVKENEVIAESGVYLPKMAMQMAKRQIAGFHFFAGIPGTIGGAIVMNAGCLGKETKSILNSVTYIDEFGDIKETKTEELQFEFRTSMFHGKNNIILSAKFKLENADDLTDSITLTKNAIKIRKEKFPMAVATAGSTFKSPVNGPYPGQLVESIGLKGYKVGNAQISNVHGNWIINLGEARSEDIKQLISHMQKKVFEEFSIKLDPEVIFV